MQPVRNLIIQVDIFLTNVLIHNFKDTTKKDFKEIKLNMNFDFSLFRFGNNHKNIDFIDKKILKKVQNYTLDVWKFSKKRNILHI